MGYQFSIIMPALNEERNIERAIREVIAALERLQITGEIIVVNDGSTDRTAMIVEEQMQKFSFIRLIHHAEPQGIGASYWEAAKMATGNYVTWMPGDAETNCYEALRYYYLFEHVDVIVPFIFNREARSLRRNLVSKIYKGIINLSFGTLLNYMNGATLYRRCVLQQLDLKTTGFFFQVELLIKSIRLGYLYAEVPCALNKRLHGESKALTVKSFFRIMRDYLTVLSTIYSYRKNLASLHPESKSALYSNTLHGQI